MTGTEFYILVGVGLVVVLIIGIVLRVKGIGYKNDKKKAKGGKASKTGEKEEFYKPEAYVDHGDDGDTEWKDSDLHDLEVGKDKGKYRDIFEEKPRKGQDKKESWDDY